MRMIENECGRFYTDDSGMLTHFACGAKNCLSLPVSPESRTLFCLHIPEGVRALPVNAFRDFTVRHDVTFPDSLTSVGAGAFSCCELSHMVLPLRAELGADVFSGSDIRKVTVPEGMAPERVERAAHALRFTHSAELVRDWPAQYAHIFYGRNESIKDWTQIRNSCGTFYIDSDGVLRDFWCDQDNRIKGNGLGNAENAYLRLNFPEGVKVIPGELFERCIVLWELTFPKTLKCIGTASQIANTFAGSILPDVVLPENLELLGSFAFGVCTARSVTIPPALRGRLNYRGSSRDFKDSCIGEIRVPVQFRKMLEDIIKNPWYCMGETETGELCDPTLGKLFYVKAKNGTIRGGAVLPALLQKIAQNG